MSGEHKHVRGMETRQEKETHKANGNMSGKQKHVRQMESCQARQENGIVNRNTSVEQKLIRQT